MPRSRELDPHPLLYASGMHARSVVFDSLSRGWPATTADKGHRARSCGPARMQ